MPTPVQAATKTWEWAQFFWEYIGRVQVMGCFERGAGGDGVGFWLPVGAERGPVPLSAEVKLLGFNICCKV